MVATPLTLHPWRGLRLIAGPGVEVRRDEPAEFLFRFGVGYLFHVGQFSVGPEFNVDVVEAHPTFVASLAFGYAF